MAAHSPTDLKGLVKQVFADKYGSDPHYFMQAPGRVNLMGEHTDYNDGFVLPCAIRYQTMVAIRPRQDSQIRVTAADFDAESDVFSISSDVAEHPDQLWSNYIRGVVKYFAMYAESVNPEVALQGADFVISGNVPQGAGLSSSASLEVAIGATLNYLNKMAFSPSAIARIGQQAENDFVGCRCGIMDQMASACGVAGKALMLDCRSLATKLISMPAELSIMIINSNVQRGLVDSEYNIRRQQCEQAAKWFGVKALRDVDLSAFDAGKAGLDPIVVKRAKHIVTENARTLAAAEALQNADVIMLSELMAASHKSMKNDFEITVPELDLIVDIVADVLGKEGGVRMTGGGFGGCAVALVPGHLVDKVKEALSRDYSTATGLDEHVYVTTACNGAGLV